MKRDTFSVVMAMVMVAILGLPHSTIAADEKAFFAAEDTAVWVGEEGKYQVWEGSGSGSHVGAFTAYTLVHVKGLSGQAEGLTTLTCGDGSELWVAHASTWNQAEFCWEGGYQIVGGTGRFENAGGSGDVLVCAPDYTLQLGGNHQFLNVPSPRDTMDIHGPSSRGAKLKQRR